NPVTFKWKSQPDGKRHLGLIAQEVMPLVPEVVDTGDDPDKTLGINYAGLVPVLISAIKEQQKQIESQDLVNQQLKSELQSLREEMEQIKGMLDQ
ncbi:MAG: tail fiber domain-containing protein, partial [Bacteroidia bacterium]|nr:tail fiber domain-containing protein [Bacteroidia bacterium]